MVGRVGPVPSVNVLVPEGSLVAGARIVLDEGEAHHLRVRRVTAGETVRLLDGVGGLAEGTIEAGKKEIAVLAGAVRREDAPPATVLAVGAGDRDRFAWLVEKGAELGVTEVVPLETEHARGVASRIREGQLVRLRQRAREAIKQCGASWAPAVRAPVSIEEFLGEDRAGLRWLAARDGSAPPARIAPVPVTVAVGPEGGFTEGEIVRLSGAGFVPVRFGPHILRLETAALAAAVSVSIARMGGADG